MKRRSKGMKEAVAWYSKERFRYSGLVSTLKEVLRSLLDGAHIDFVDIQGRCKEVVSFEEKIKRKQYTDAKEEMTDLAGLRIIVLIEADIVRVKDIIAKAFQVYEEFSLDKSAHLSSDRFGYRSLHLVCDIGPTRAELPEYKRFSGLKFEIQIRTALQHAWAEIEHDRGYKLGGELPSHLKRKFSQLAGLLELADSSFNELTAEIDTYSRSIADKARQGDFRTELNSSSILEVLVMKFGKNISAGYGDDEQWPGLISELKAFGISNLDEFAVLLTPERIKLMRKSNSGLAIPGLVRDAMMFADLELYMRRAWQKHWGAIDATSVEVFCEAYGSDVVDKLLLSKVDVYEEGDVLDFEESGNVDS